MNRTETGRRTFLRTALAAGAQVVAEGPLGSRSRAGERQAWRRPLTTPLGRLSATRNFAPVRVERNRIIRTVTGLRPYRDEGFVVEAERLGDKLLVHNYGHGGAGVAVDIARDFL